jgi:polyisoprenoid-binding protein YceI
MNPARAPQGNPISTYTFARAPISMLIACLVPGLAVATTESPPGVLVDEAPPAIYRFDPQTSRIEARVFEDPRTNGSGRSHDHVVVATQWAGRIAWDKDGVCGGEAVFDLAGFQIDQPADRKLAGMDGQLSATDMAIVRTHMLAREQLDVHQFPEVRYEILGCSAREGGGWTLQGDLTLHGVKQPVALALTGSVTDEKLSLDGRGSILQTRFGIEPYFALFGQRRNQDRVELVIHLQGSRLPAGTPAVAPLNQPIGVPRLPGG